MKGLWFDLWSLEIASEAIGFPVDFYVTTSEGLSTAAQFYEFLNECAKEGQINKNLTLSMDIEFAIFGNRWDSKMLRLQCVSVDDVVAGLIQSIFGEYFFAAVGSDAERVLWRNKVTELMSSIGYVSFDFLFENSHELIKHSEGVQIWFANDCGFGENSIRSMVATGCQEKLEKMFEILKKIDMVTDAYGLRGNPSLPRWVELPATSP